jgi:hypothetical protein
MARPTKRDTKYFQRKLTPEELVLLLQAGEGNITEGWLELQRVYVHAWNLGYRPFMPLESIEVTYSMQDAIDGVPSPFEAV